jgi:predicted ATPase/transcriptional regulator with XRE-family HTH domain
VTFWDNRYAITATMVRCVMPAGSAHSPASLLESFATFGEMLKYLRRRARLTQTELAIAVGYSREQITKLENNQRRPDLAALRALFVPALDLDERPDIVERLLLLAAATRPTKPSRSDEPNPTQSSPTNLHTPLTSFVGRELEIAEVDRLLGATRLLTLTGAGGVGKTRLALQVGVALRAAFADGVWLVELAALADPAFVPQAVALALGLTSGSARPIDTVLADYLRDKHLLLILDNCEHLLVACARLAEFILREAPQVRILTTSRESLGVLSATTWHVPSLSLPDRLPETNTPPLIEQLRESEAVRLFVDRAKTAKADFVLTSRNARAVAQICCRLDGMPLAIELAATRLRVMAVQEIAARLDDRFKLLTSGNSTALPRHQTLRAMIDWSYDLLADQQRALLRRLSVFAGGWALEAVEWMGTADEALDLLTHLVNKSLVVVEEHDNTTRYRLLETIGAYAREKLVQATEEHHARAQHLDYYIHLVEQAAPHLTSRHRKIWNERLELEHDNLRAGLEWATRHAMPAALDLIARLWFFWFWNGYWSEGTAWADRVLPATVGEQTRERAWALIGAANLAGRSGDYARQDIWLAEGVALAQALDEKEALAWARITMSILTAEYAQARALLEESIALARAAKNDWLVADALFMIGDRARNHGDLDRATTVYTESLSLFHTVGDPLMIAWPRGNLGRLALQRGDYAQAQAAFEESVELCRQMGNKPGTADWLIQLATVALYRSDYTQVRSALVECLRLCREIGNAEAVADCLVIAAGLAEANRNWERAATLLAMADSILERYNLLHRMVDSSSYTEYTRRVAAVRVRLSEHSFATAWAAGRAMESGRAIQYALADDGS